jgi:sec-independent protein translocase protein TatA
MFPNLGPMELILVMGVGVLLFGKRLPEVGRSLGRGIVEFKKGLNGVGDDFDSSSSGRSSGNSHGSSRYSDDRPRSEPAYSDASVPKFELPGTTSSSGSTAADPAQSAPVPQMDYPATSRD